MTKDFVLDLVRQGEGQTIEFKEELPKVNVGDAHVAVLEVLRGEHRPYRQTTWYMFGRAL